MTLTLSQMTFVPDRFSVGYKGHFEVTYALYHACIKLCRICVASLVPRPRPKTGRGLGGYELLHYARSTQCVAVNCEVPVTLYSVCIRAEKACL